MRITELLLENVQDPEDLAKQWCSTKGNPFYQECIAIIMPMCELGNNADTQAYARWKKEYSDQYNQVKQEEVSNNPKLGRNKKALENVVYERLMYQDHWMLDDILQDIWEESGGEDSSEICNDPEGYVKEQINWNNGGRFLDEIYQKAVDLATRQQSKNTEIAQEAEEPDDTPNMDQYWDKKDHDDREFPWDDEQEDDYVDDEFKSANRIDYEANPDDEGGMYKTTMISPSDAVDNDEGFNIQDIHGREVDDYDPTDVKLPGVEDPDRDEFRPDGYRHVDYEGYDDYHDDWEDEYNYDIEHDFYDEPDSSDETAEWEKDRLAGQLDPHLSTQDRLEKMQKQKEKQAAQSAEQRREIARLRKLAGIKRN